MANERVGTIKSYFEGPRWAAFPSFLKKACFMYDLEIVKLDIDGGFIRETVYFQVEGTETNLMRLKRAIGAGMYATLCHSV